MKKIIKVNEDWIVFSRILTENEGFRNGFVMITKKTGFVNYCIYNEKTDGEYEGIEEVLEEYEKHPEKYVKIEANELINNHLWEREKVEEILKLMKKYNLYPKGSFEGCEYPYSLPPECPKCGYSKHFGDLFCAQCGTEFEERDEIIDVKEMWEELNRKEIKEIEIKDLKEMEEEE